MCEFLFICLFAMLPSCCYHTYMGVNPKIGENHPKWMVKIMENPIKIDDLGVPLFLEIPIS